MKTRISSKGQVVNPKAYRQKLGWEPGTDLVVEEEAGQLVLKRPTKVKNLKIRDVAGILHRPGIKAATLQEMDAAVAEKWGNGRR